MLILGRCSELFDERGLIYVGCSDASDRGRIKKQIERKRLKRGNGGFLRVERPECDWWFSDVPFDAALDEPAEPNTAPEALRLLALALRPGTIGRQTSRTDACWRMPDGEYARKGFDAVLLDRDVDRAAFENNMRAARRLYEERGGTKWTGDMPNDIGRAEFRCLYDEARQSVINVS